MPTLNVFTNGACLTQIVDQIPSSTTVPGDRVEASDVLKTLSSTVASSVGKPEAVGRSQLATRACTKPRAHTSSCTVCAHQPAHRQAHVFCGDRSTMRGTTIITCVQVRHRTRSLLS